MIEYHEEAYMGEIIEFPEIDLIEVVAAPTINADGVARAVLIDDRIHIVLYADQVGNTGDIEHHTVLRLIMKADVQKNASTIIASAILKGLGQKMKNVFKSVPKKDMQ